MDLCPNTFNHFIFSSQFRPPENILKLKRQLQDDTLSEISNTHNSITDEEYTENENDDNFSYDGSVKSFNSFDMSPKCQEMMEELHKVFDKEILAYKKMHDELHEKIISMEALHEKIDKYKKDVKNNKIDPKLGIKNINNCEALISELNKEINKLVINLT